MKGRIDEQNRKSIESKKIETNSEIDDLYQRQLQ